MNLDKSNLKLYNVLFPLWLLLLFPFAWAVVLPANFIIDSIALIIIMSIFKIKDKKKCYKNNILKVFIFGMLSDIVGSGFMLVLHLKMRIGRMGDELYIVIPGIMLSIVSIFLSNYYFTFTKHDQNIRFKFSLILSIVTAPYTFLVRSSCLYN